MILEHIPDPGVGSVLPDSVGGCLFVWPHNPMGYNENVVSTYEVFVTSHIK